LFNQTQYMYINNRGAQAVVLGCTELPLAIGITSEQGVPIVNSIDSLVQAVIKQAA